MMLLQFAFVTVVSLFPSDTLTVPDPTQATGLRVNLPLPPCSIAAPSPCNEILALNTLDGFSVNPRIEVRYSGPVDTSTLRSTIFITPADAPFDLIPINQVVYDPQTFTVYAKPDRVLDQQRQYRLTVFLPDGGYTSTTFTTLSAATWLDRVRANLSATAPSLTLTKEYLFSDIETLTLHEQIHANPSRFMDISLPAGPIRDVGGIVFGTYQSPTYLNAQQTIDPMPTGLNPGSGLRYNQISFHAIMPLFNHKPAAGWPVVIFGHGLGDSQYGAPSAVTSIAGTLAASGFAIVSINAVGHGYGPESTLDLHLSNGDRIQLPAGGRSIADSTGNIAPYGGCIVLEGGLGIRDCLRQTAIDLMQFVRVLKSGLPDLDPSRIYYVGHSLGSLYGTLLMALEPGLNAVTLNVGGGSIADIAQWSPAFHGLAQLALAVRKPSLLNEGSNFNENYVLRDQPVKVNDVPGAIDIQNFFERLDWADMIGDPLAYAPLLRGKKVLFQFAKGDLTVPNSTESALVREAHGQQSTWLFLNDRIMYPTLPVDPHAYLLADVNSFSVSSEVAFGAQYQIAGFFASNGTTIPDPNPGSFMVFEVPTKLP